MQRLSIILPVRIPKTRMKARLTLNLETQEIVKINSDHNHDIDIVVLAVRDIRHKRRQAAISTKTPKQIMANAIDGFGYEVLRMLPSYVALNTVIIAIVREVRENINRNRLILRIIQLWCFHHYHIVISHNTI